MRVVSVPFWEVLDKQSEDYIMTVMADRTRGTLKQLPTVCARRALPANGVGLLIAVTSGTFHGALSMT